MATTSSSRQDQTHPDFNDPDADITLVSSDHIHFSVQRLFLVAASSVLADMFASVQDPAGSGLPQVKMAEDSSSLYRYLTYLYRAMQRPRTLRAEDALNLINMADKYDSPIVLELALTRLRPNDQLNIPPRVFGAAVAHGDLDLARKALRLFDTKGPTLLELWMAEQNVGRVDRPQEALLDASAFAIIQGEAPPPIEDGPIPHLELSYSLDDVPAKYLDRFSAEAIQNFTQLQGYEAPWADKAQYFFIGKPRIPHSALQSLSTRRGPY